MTADPFMRVAPSPPPPPSLPPSPVHVFPRYGIGAEELRKLLRLDARVEVFILFIGTTGQAAERMTSKLPKGRVFTIADTATIPQILRQIFSFTMLRAKM